MTKKTQTKELTVAVVEKKLTPMIQQSKKLSIGSAKDMVTATEMVSEFKIQLKLVTDRMETLTKPAKEVVKAAEAIWKPFIVQAKEAIENIRNKQSEYQTEQVRITREKEAKIASNIKPGKGHLSFEVGVQKMQEIERPEESIHTDLGSTGFREEPQFEIENLAQLPIEYHLADEVKVRAAMKRGEKLPGVRYFTKQVPVNSAKRY